MSRRDTIAALLTEHAHCSSSVEVVESGRGILHYSCGAVVTEVRGLRRADFAHVADVIDRALDQESGHLPGCQEFPTGWLCMSACTTVWHPHQDKARKDEDAPESCGERHPTNPTALACCLDRGHVEDHYSTTGCPGSVVRWPRHSHPIDEPRQDEGGDRGALAEMLWKAEKEASVSTAGYGDTWGSEPVRHLYRAQADAVLAWMRDQGFRRHPEEPEGTAATRRRRLLAEVICYEKGHRRGTPVEARGDYCINCWSRALVHVGIFAAGVSDD